MKETKFKIAVVQNRQGQTKDLTLSYIEKDLKEAIKNRAKMIFLGEFCNMLPYSGTTSDIAEDLNETDSQKAPTVNLFKRIAKQHQVYIIGGLLEKTKNNSKPYNSAIVVGKNGEIITVCRKLHLFDAYFKDINYRAQESKVFTPGFEITTFDTEWCKMGLAICYDIRFPELAQIFRQQGCKVIIYPAAFGLKTKTGMLHWDLLVRSRALDSQCYAIGAQPSRHTENQNIYQTWGNSKIVNPLGIVVAGAQPNEDLYSNQIFYADIDLELIDYVREQQFRYQYQRRLDVYNLPTAKL